MKLKHDEKAKLGYMDTDSFITHIKTKNIYYEDITNDVDKRFDTSVYEFNSIKCNRPLPMGKSKKVVALRAKTYSYLRDGEKLRKTKEQKNV